MEYPDGENPWTTLDRCTLYDNPWITVREDRVIRPDGAEGIYGVVHFKNRAMGVLPVEDDGAIWLVGQHRYPLDQYSWEIPEGGCPEDESLEDCARRELEEETGLQARSLELILSTHLSNSVSDEWGVVFRATGLTQGESRPEGSERLAVRRVPFAEALAMVARGAITDSLSVMAILHEAARRAGALAGTSRRLALHVLDGALAITRLDPHEPIPTWAAGQPLLAIVRTMDELSIVSLADAVPEGVRAGRGWRALRVEGPFDLAETGVLSALAAPLAAAAIPVFAVSTFDTDYLLVREADVSRAADALRGAGHAVSGGAMSNPP
jgi:8-oxo-dGTP pyrophosphatase MutT (NUDIX family)